MKFYKEDPDYDEIYYEIISNKFTAIISSKNLATNDSCVYFLKKDYYTIIRTLLI